MKKLLLVSLIAAFGLTNVYANKIVNLSDSMKSRIDSWKISDYHDGYTYYNGLSENRITRVFVNEYMYHDGRDAEKSDKVTFTCNGETFYLIPGKWTTCSVEPGKTADLDIEYSNFKHGAEGVIEMVD